MKEEDNVYKLIKVLFLLIISITAVSACDAGLFPGSEATREPRTYFETLDLSTPEAAARSFAHAFEKNDFMTSYLVLHPDAQTRLRQEWSQTFRWRHLIGERADQALIDEFDYEEVIGTHSDPWYLFDYVMYYADQMDDLLFDIKGEPNFYRSQELLSRDGKPVIDLGAVVTGVSGDIIFRMVQGGDSRWRVYRISVPEQGITSWPSTILDNTP
jgi:hypothetical protein